jgi:transposase InsO family protein
LSAEHKQQVLDLVELTQRRSQWPLEPILACLGLPRSVYFAWRARAQQGQLEDLPRTPASYERLLPEEVEAIKAFALRHPKVGYRKLSYLMLDQDIVAVSESAVYRVLREADLLSRWKRSSRSSGVYSFKATGPNQQWHTDVMYVWVGCRHYFLLSFVDAYSRYVVHHRLLTELTGRAVAIELEAALSACGEAKPRIVHDHGSEFCNTELRAVIKAHDVLDIRTRARHPESNGIVERFNGTVRQDSDDYYGDNYLSAERTVERLIHQYNHVRLHAALGYLEPKEVHFGNPEQRREARRQKLEKAREQRRAQNRSLLAA